MSMRVRFGTTIAFFIHAYWRLYSWRQPWLCLDIQYLRIHCIYIEKLAVRDWKKGELR